AQPKATRVVRRTHPFTRRNANRVAPLLLLFQVERLRHSHSNWKLDLRKTVLAVDACVLEAFLDLERHAHEADLRAALDHSESRHPEAPFVQAVLDGDRGDLRLHWRNHRLDPNRHVVHRLWI